MKAVMTIPADAKSADVVLRAQSVRKTFGRGETAVTALDDISVDFEAGRFSAIMGPSGSGKSTFMHVLAGLDRVDSGSITMGGQDITGLNDKELTQLRRDRVGFIFQAFNLVPTLSAEQNIELPVSLARQRIDPEWKAEVVDRLELGDRLKHRPHELSGGQQQRVAVARALLTRPDVIFADEPTGNLDSQAGAEVLALLHGATTRYGQTIILVTHDPVAASHADRVVLLKDGRAGGEVHQPTKESVVSALGELSDL
ncbi:ABC transporter ATP-binding protein [Brevibacterium aurantiacum]|uniref:ABC transporter n=3 Tax=Brevibacterium aurantiacum TaxID=273384 RepID=A0A2A3ZQ09_BREAU|nr:ABC transporter ATP-binding protein [Brevibacterium aurantiacum]AZL12861.1 ABC transporter ATP-binding protein [Brevibacterium aurantiacum]AZT93325.1 ABC transporter ATP-binding protein [Brevibacterium aurantiacum]AZT97150.1 ABC transporter ATP-binding protein [Brevibacterium aurantiacum]PCC53616.1 ABC transporter [Brevibacterium aurantiacum]